MLLTERVQPTEANAAVAAQSTDRPTLTITPEQMNELRATAQMLASTDPAFRDALVQNPRDTLAALIEMNSGAAYELQETIDVVTLEQAENTVLVVVPSPDKAIALNTELAKLSLEVANSPEARSALMASPREVLESFLEANGSSAVTLPADKEVKVRLEDGGELIVVVPQASSSPGMSVATGELLSASALEMHMSCLTCHCTTAASCTTGGCCTASGCSTWSSSCR